MGKNNPWGKLGKRVVGDCSTTQIIMNVCNELLTSCPWWGRFVDRDHVYDHLLSVGFFKKTLVPWCGDKMIRWSQSAISLQLNEVKWQLQAMCENTEMNYNQLQMCYNQQWEQKFQTAPEGQWSKWKMTRLLGSLALYRSYNQYNGHILCMTTHEWVLSVDFLSGPPPSFSKSVSKMTIAMAETHARCLTTGLK